MRKGLLRRLARLNETFTPPAGLLAPEEREALDQFVDACVAAGGGQQPDEPRAAAMARGLGLSGPAELRRLLEERGR